MNLFKGVTSGVRLGHTGSIATTPVDAKTTPLVRMSMVPVLVPTVGVVNTVPCRVPRDSTDDSADRRVSA